MEVLIKEAKIMDPRSDHNGKIVDILVQKGRITQIASSISKKIKNTISSQELHISPGWIDIGATCWDPGFEYREDIKSLRAAASKGGYTQVFIWPNTDPIIDNKAQYQYIINNNDTSAVQISPICSMTKKSEGKELSEMIDLHQAGASLFSDGLTFRGKDKELYKALEYLKSIDATLLFAPNVFGIYPEGQLHESPTSIALGVQGLPEINEVMSIQRITALAEYAETECIMHNVSTSNGLKQCKSKGVKSVGVSYLNLCKEVEDCASFDTNHKVIPPLRSKKDVKALQKAIVDQKIDYISSNHFPLEEDLKDMEFGLARFGASGIETVFAGLISDGAISLDTIINALTYGPAAASGMDVTPINEGSMANVTLFDPMISWTYNNKTKASKCSNNPFFNKELKGKALGVLNDGKLILNK